MATATAPSQARANGKEQSPLDQVLDATERAMVRTDMLQMRLENETIMAECRTRRRNFEEIKDELQAALDAFPALAEEAIYNKPVGREPGSDQQKYASGLSIRAAELLAEAYGFNRVRSDVSPIDLTSVKVEASFTDYQKGRVWQDGGILSKQYKTRSGQIGLIPDDRFYNVVCKAEISKRIREVILRSVNAGLKAWFENYCHQKMASLLDDGKMDQIVKGFQELKVTLAQVEELVGTPKAMGWTVEHRRFLAGIYNALKQGETTIEELLSNGAADKKAEDVAEKLDKAAPAKSKEPEATKPKEEPAKEAPKEAAKEESASEELLGKISTHIRRLKLSEEAVRKCLKDRKAKSMGHLTKAQAEEWLAKLADEPDQAEGQGADGME